MRRIKAIKVEFSNLVWGFGVLRLLVSLSRYLKQKQCVLSCFVLPIYYKKSTYSEITKLVRWETAGDYFLKPSASEPNPISSFVSHDMPHSLKKKRIGRE